MTGDGWRSAIRTYRHALVALVLLGLTVAQLGWARIDREPYPAATLPSFGTPLTLDDDDDARWLIEVTAVHDGSAVVSELTLAELFSTAPPSFPGTLIDRLATTTAAERPKFEAWLHRYVADGNLDSCVTTLRIRRYESSPQPVHDEVFTIDGGCS